MYLFHYHIDSNIQIIYNDFLQQNLSIKSFGRFSSAKTIFNHVKNNFAEPTEMKKQLFSIRRF